MSPKFECPQTDRQCCDSTGLADSVKSRLIIDAWGLVLYAQALDREPELAEIVKAARRGRSFEGIVCAIHPKRAFTNHAFVSECLAANLSVLTVEAEGGAPRNENMIECAVRAAAAFADPTVDEVVLVGWYGPLSALARMAFATGKPLVIADFDHTGVERFRGVADEIVLLGWQHLRRRS